MLGNSEHEKTLEKLNIINREGKKKPTSSLEKTATKLAKAKLIY